MQSQFLAPVELFFKQLKGYSFKPGRNQYFFIYAVFSAVWSVMSTLLSKMERSTIVEGQTLGTVHIMEGTCSRLRFFMRNMNTDMCIYTYSYTIMYTYIYKKYMYIYICVYAVGWLVGWSCCCGVVWCGVVVVVVSLSLVFSHLKLVRSKGFFR